MRVCFLSEKLCALKIGGAYLGFVDGFERTTELDPKDGLFCELSPCGGEFLPLCFRFDEAFLLSPPPQAELYYTEQGVAVYLSGFLRADQTLRVLKQERFGGSLFTLTRQGKLQLALDNETGFHLTELPDCFETCTFSANREGFLLTAPTAFALLSHSPFHDSLGHTALCEWREGKLVNCSIRAAGEPTPATFALALFESALIGADVRPFLSDALAQKAGSLKEYLGDFRSVVLTDSPEKVGLVYPRKERVFDVRYYSVELSDGKISNIKPL